MCKRCTHKISIRIVFYVQMHTYINVKYNNALKYICFFFFFDVRIHSSRQRECTPHVYDPFDVFNVYWDIFGYNFFSCLLLDWPSESSIRCESVFVWRQVISSSVAIQPNLFWFLLCSVCVIFFHFGFLFCLCSVWSLFSLILFSSLFMCVHEVLRASLFVLHLTYCTNAVCRDISCCYFLCSFRYIFISIFLW